MEMLIWYMYSLMYLFVENISTLYYYVYDCWVRTYPWRWQGVWQAVSSATKHDLSGTCCFVWWMPTHLSQYRKQSVMPCQLEHHYCCHHSGRGWNSYTHYCHKDQTDGTVSPGGRYVVLTLLSGKTLYGVKRAHSPLGILNRHQECDGCANTLQHVLRVGQVCSA